MSDYADTVPRNALDEAQAKIRALEAEVAKTKRPDDGVRFHCAHCDYGTSRRDISELMQHVTEAHANETFCCQNRVPLPNDTFGGLRDCWEKQPNGDLTCTYCGSMSENDFVAIMEHFIAGEEGYSFEPSDKGYKIYAHRPGVSNAGNGGIKFYGWHVDREHADRRAREDLFKRCCAESSRRHREMMERQCAAFKKQD